MLFFFLIVAVPFLIVLVAFVRPDLLEQIIREPSGTGPARQTLERRDQTPIP